MDFIWVIKNYSNTQIIIKKKFKLKVGIITFEPAPKMYFNKSIKNFRIFNLDQKKIFLKN